MSGQSQSRDDDVKQRSGWLIPLTVFAATALLSALFLLFYLAPTPNSFIEEHQAPTARTDLIALSVGGLSLRIPANYLLYASARQGGARKRVEIFASYPEFHGFSDWNAQDFNGNAPDSPIIYMLIREEPYGLDEEAQLRRVYMGYVADPSGKPAPFDLTAYAFRDDSAYRDEDLFVGKIDNRPIVMRCVRLSQEVPSPSCLRDIRLSSQAVLTYRFKRSHLADWREIAGGVRALVASFHVRSK